jgi:hopanoid C-3 methylase
MDHSKKKWKVLLVHPSALMYSEVYLRLEPLGLELVAEACRRNGFAVRLLDLQASRHKDYFRAMEQWRPDAVGFSLNYLANVPEVIDLAKATRERWPETFVFAGGHSASFIAREILEHGAGAIDCMVKGEGEGIAPKLLEAARDDRRKLDKLPGVVTREGEGPVPELVESLDELRPARDLLAHRRKYFIGVLDPAASIEFTRGCPWDCVFCSAWTFYGRNYRLRSAEASAEDLARVGEPGVFIVDDVAFIQADHGMAIGREIEKRGIKKRYYLETRGDVLLRNKEVFRYWKRLGLEYIFLGLEAIDEEGLKLHRKRVTLSKNFEALEFARELGITVAINIIADPGWDEERFAVIREWALSVPEIVHLTVNTPYPGTETWRTESRGLTTRDYRLFDVQHAVLPTKLPLEEFYRQLVSTQQVLNRKHLGWAALKDTFVLAAKLAICGQTNFVRMLWKFNSVYNVERQAGDHRREVSYEMNLPGTVTPGRVDRGSLFIHPQDLLKPLRATASAGQD